MGNPTAVDAVGLVSTLMMSVKAVVWKQQEDARISPKVVSAICCSNLHGPAAKLHIKSFQCDYKIGPLTRLRMSAEREAEISTMDYKQVHWDDGSGDPGIRMSARERWSESRTKAISDTRGHTGCSCRAQTRLRRRSNPLRGKRSPRGSVRTTTMCGGGFQRERYHALLFFLFFFFSCHASPADSFFAQASSISFFVRDAKGKAVQRELDGCRSRQTTGREPSVDELINQSHST
ncbi:hypothetical protein BHM03_00011683 [Ensete ventricosum]|nr:hypothetical protein BHM03_00011683 [Ensete ventricosum]